MLTLLQSGNVELFGIRRYLAYRYPASNLLIELLQLVAGNWFAAIIVRLLPLQLATILGNILHLQRTLRPAWTGQNGNLYLSLILTVFVLGLDLVHTTVLTQAVLQRKLGVVILVDDLVVVIAQNWLLLYNPCDLWLGFTLYIDIVVNHFAGSDDDRFQVCTIDTRFQLTMLHYMRLGRVRFGRTASLVDSHDAELTLGVFLQIIDRRRCLTTIDLAHIFPILETILLLYHVLLNRSTTVRLRGGPLQLDRLVIEVHNIWRAGFPRFVVRVLRNHFLRFQRFTVTLGINADDAELVRRSFVQSGDIRF
uniref:Uncharacterized protein n=1 Tax=Anopheles christyi TaxID=43041 RepID=A0A182KHQ8_9DIPT